MVKAIDIHRTIEWRTAHWAGQHLSGARVYAPGSIAFWFNAFSDVAQLSGGFDQGDLQRVMPAVRYQILAGADGAVARDWLRIYGCDAVIVSGPASEEQFKPYAYPRKFDGVLPVLWRESDVTIYAVPRRSRSLAHVVRQADLAPAFPPGRQPASGVTALSDGARRPRPARSHFPVAGNAPGAHRRRSSTRLPDRRAGGLS